MSLKVWFDVQQLYYVPQYEPVYRRLSSLGHQCHFVIHQLSASEEILETFLEMTELPVSAMSEADTLEFYRENPADWIIFGNTFKHFDQLPSSTKTALLYHGIGVKECYYGEGLSKFDVRFTEGHFRQLELSHRYPKANFVETGFAKLDPLAAKTGFSEVSFDLENAGLSSNKPTLLYAPTFYPSSIELMEKNWPAVFADCNIIIKPHFFSYTNKKYKAQRKLIEHWNTFDNVYLAKPTELSLIPYMATADILISEASSALFEFAALDKPVIWLDFFKLRWGYRGPFRYRFEKRMDQTIHKYRDVGRHVDKVANLEVAIREELANPASNQSNRSKTTQELIGLVDGKVAERIVDYLINNR